MKIETPFNVGDCVYIVHNGQIVKAKIAGIEVYTFSNIPEHTRVDYIFHLGCNDVRKESYKVFKTIQEAIESGESLLDRLLPKDILHMVKGNK